MGVGGVAVGPSLEIRGEGARSSPHFSKLKFVGPQADATDSSPELGDVRSPVITVADLRLDTVERTVKRGDREIALAGSSVAVH